MDASPAQVEALTAKQIKKLAKRNEKDRLAKLAGSSQAIPSPIVQGGHKRGRADEEEDRDVLVKQPKKKKQHKPLPADLFSIASHASSSYSQPVTAPTPASAPIVPSDAPSLLSPESILKAARKSAKKAAKRLAASQLEQQIKDRVTLETEASLPQVGNKTQGGAEESTLNDRSTHSMDSGEVESSKAERKARKTIRKQKAKDQLEDEARTLALEALKKEVGDNIIMEERGESKRARKEERKAKRKEEERVEAAMESSTLEFNLPSKSMEVEEVQQKATRPTKVKQSKKPKSIPLDDVTPPADVAVSIEKLKRKKMTDERGEGKERGVEDDDDDEEVNSKKKKRKSAAIIKPTKIMKKTALSKRMIVDSDDEDHDIIGTEDEEETAGEVKTIRRRTKRPPPVDIASLTNFDVLTTKWMTASQLRAMQVERGPSFTYKQGKFSDQEDITIRSTVADYAEQHSLDTVAVEALFLPRGTKKGDGIWTMIAQALGNRPLINVLAHVKRLYNVENHLGKWSSEEDGNLRASVLEYGNNWVKASEATGRAATSCRDRFKTHVKNGGIGAASSRTWSEEELAALKKARNEIGENNWEAISKVVGTRTVQQCRLRWTEGFNQGFEIDGRPPPMMKGEYARLVNAVQQTGAQDASEVHWSKIDDSVLRLRGGPKLARHWSVFVKMAARVDSGNRPFKNAIKWGLSHFTDINDKTKMPQSGQKFNTMFGLKPGNTVTPSSPSTSSDSESSLSTSSDSEPNTDQDDEEDKTSNKARGKEVLFNGEYRKKSTRTLEENIEKKRKKRTALALETENLKASSRKKAKSQKSRLEAEEFKNAIETDDSD